MASVSSITPRSPMVGGSGHHAAAAATTSSTARGSSGPRSSHPYPPASSSSSSSRAAATTGNNTNIRRSSRMGNSESIIDTNERSEATAVGVVGSATTNGAAGAASMSSPPYSMGQGLWKVPNTATPNWSPAATATAPSSSSSNNNVNRQLPLRFFEGGTEIYDSSTTPPPTSKSAQQQKQKTSQQLTQQNQQQQTAHNSVRAPEGGRGGGGGEPNNNTTKESSSNSNSNNQNNNSSSSNNSVMMMTTDDNDNDDNSNDNNDKSNDYGDNDNSINNDDVIDGIPINKLREIAKLSLGTNQVTGLPSTGVFYSSLLYAKTQKLQDAYLYAHSLYKNGEYKRCVRILEQCNIINGYNDGTVTRELRLEAILLAADALATIQEWQSVLDLIEDVTQQLVVAWNHNASDQSNNNNNGKNNININNNINTPFTAGTWTMNNGDILDDQDDIGWDALFQSVKKPNKDYIHPFSRLCLLRGRAYSEVGHPTRAALYWKRAIKLDPKCVEALDNLLSRCVITPHEAYELISSLQFEKGMEWLRHFYLARIELSPQDTSNLVNDEEHHRQQNSYIDNSYDDSIAAAAQGGSQLISTQGAAGPEASPSFPLHSFDVDASAIQMMSPQQHHQQQNYQQQKRHGSSRQQQQQPSPVIFNQGSYFDKQAPPSGGGIPPPAGGTRSDQKLPRKSPMQKDVDTSFQQLWKEYKLKNSPEVLSMAARRAYKRYDWKNALRYCQQLSIMDPLCQTAAYVYVSTLVALGHKRPLFTLAHEWVDASPRSPRAWFAVGCYYYACERYHVAQRHFCRATRLDPHCTEAWIAFGCSFASCDESDQALASFRAAQRLSPGEYPSLLYMGTEYLRTNHLVLAQYFLTSAFKASGGDPLCLNELGVLSIQRGDHPTAIGWFIRAIKACVQDSMIGGDFFDNDNNEIDTNNDYDEDELTIEACLDNLQDPYWEPTVFNLGQSYRKTRNFIKATICFERCIALCPDNSSGYAALAFTKHLMGHVDNAIDLYHQALSCKPDDPFCSEMLNKALQEALTSSNFENIGDYNNISSSDPNSYGEYHHNQGIDTSMMSGGSYGHHPHDQYHQHPDDQYHQHDVPVWKKLIPPTSPVYLGTASSSSSVAAHHAHAQHNTSTMNMSASSSFRRGGGGADNSLLMSSCDDGDITLTTETGGDGVNSQLHISVGDSADDIDMSIA